MESVYPGYQRVHTLTELSDFLVEHDYDGTHRNVATPADIAEVQATVATKADQAALDIVSAVVALPTPSSDYRGYMYRVEGAAGVADGLWICEKDATDTYVWRAL